MASTTPSYIAASDNLADQFNPVQFFAGPKEVTNKKEVLVSGQNLVRGAVLGRITASGKLTLSNNGASDGSQVPVAILAYDVDASGGDAVCQVYVSGEFNSDALTWHASFDTEAERLQAFLAPSTIVIKKLLGVAAP